MHSRLLSPVVSEAGVSDRVSPAADVVAALSRQPLQVVDRLLQFVPSGQERVLVGAGLIVLSLVIFLTWAKVTFGGRSGADDAADVDGETADSAADATETAASSTDAEGEQRATGFEQSSGNTFSWSDVDGETTTRSEAGAPVQSNTPENGADAAVGAQDAEALDDARAALADGAYERAVDDAYTTVREALQARYGVESAETPEQFVDRCASTAAVDESVLQQLEQLTDVHDRAVYGYGAATEDEAEQALSHASAILTGRTPSSSVD
jgi:hypothetical protein